MKCFEIIVLNLVKFECGFCIVKFICKSRNFVFSEFLENYKFSKSFNNIFEDSSAFEAKYQSFENLKRLAAVS